MSVFIYVSETLRKYPPESVLNLKCIKPYQIEAKRPNEVHIYLKENDHLVLPIFAIHKNLRYYSNPDKFDPERFNNENIKNIKPSTFMPLGTGSKYFINERFPIFLTKILLVHLLVKFDIISSEKTKNQFDIFKGVYNLKTDGSLWVTLKPRV